MTRTDLFIAGEGGYHSYRIPALVVTTAGKALAFCEGRRITGRDDDQIDLLMRCSDDGGVTWGPVVTVVADGERSCGNPCPVVEQHTGIIWLPFCKDNTEVWLTHCHEHGGALDGPDAGAPLPPTDAMEWSEPVNITAWAKDPSWSYVGTGPGHGIQLASGRLLIPCWCDESPPPLNGGERTWGQVQSSFALLSDDGGVTWWCSEMLSRDASDECEAVETGKGLVYMTLRSRQGMKARGRAWSGDEGETWSEVEYDTDLPEPSCQGSIVRYDETRVLMAHPSDKEARTRLVVRMSVDDCASWAVARVLEEGYGGYSDLAVTDEGDVLCMYEAYECGKLVMARFGVEWVRGEGEGG